MELRVCCTASNHDVERRYAIEELCTRAGFRVRWASDESPSSGGVPTLLYSDTAPKDPVGCVHIPAQPDVYSLASRAASRSCEWIAENSGVRFREDILAATFCALSRLEEWKASPDQLDRRGRYSSDGIATSELERPFVDESAAALREALRSVWPEGATFPERPGWNGHRFALALTHDVDTLNKFGPGGSLRRFASLGWRYAQPAVAARSFVQWACVRTGLQRDPYRRRVLEKLHAIEDAYGARGAYYFLVGGTTKAERDPVRLDSDAARWAIDFLEERGHEIGIHPSTTSSVDAELFADQVQQLRRAASSEVVGGRHHHLWFTVPQTWRHWEANELRYDSTLGFAERPGFRCGTCSPFRAFDLEKREVRQVWELPLTVMDKTLFDRSYLNLRPDAARGVVDRLLQRVADAQGVFVLLWHPGFVDDVSFPGWSKLFEYILEQARSLGAWIAPPKDILAAWPNYGESGDTQQDLESRQVDRSV